MQSINVVFFNLIQGGAVCTCSTRNHGLLYERFFLSGSGSCASWCCVDNHGINWKFDRGCILPTSFNNCSSSEYFKPTQIVIVPSVTHIPGYSGILNDAFI